MTAISISAPRCDAACVSRPAVAASSPPGGAAGRSSPSALAVISGGSALASRDDDAPSEFASPPSRSSAGESLWSIAEQVAPEADPRDVVDAIVRLNALDGVTVSAGPVSSRSPPSTRGAADPER